MKAMKLSEREALERVRRPSVGLRRGSKTSEWQSSSSCKAPRGSYSFSVQQCERFRQQQHSQPQSTYVYAQQPPKQRGTSAVPTCSRALPTIRVNIPPNDTRRCSISSPLRFTRTVSQDSIDSLERVCLQTLRWQRLLEPADSPEMPPPDRRASMIVTESSRHFPLNRQLSHNEPPRANERPAVGGSSKEIDSHSPNVLSAHSAEFRLRTIGRSKTDPGNDDAETAARPAGCPVQRRSPPTLPLPPNGERRADGQTKRSTPDLVLDVRGRILSEAIGLSIYQQRLLLQSWPQIFATGANGVFAANIFPTLCQRNQKAKQLLQKADGVAVFANSGMDCSNVHSNCWIRSSGNLDSAPGPTIAYLSEIGQCHRSLRAEGVGAAMWDDFGDAILEGVRKNDLVRKHKELRRAWLAIIAFVTDNIKLGQALFRSSPSVEISEIRLQ
ncbi:Globin-like domain and Globin, structural domain-containing protein [Aphelenchoides fujianensis]|nr:Globin-like domain and Globin, structural domain-containing protein [Aphelenchoides fujianensis]